MARWWTTLLVTMALATVGGAGAAPVVSWPFDRDLAGWNALDPSAKLAVSHDQALARPGGDGVAQLTYETTVGGLSGLGTQIQEPLTAGKSLHFWLRTEVPTILLAVVTENDGSSYNAAFYSLGAVWQEIALDLTEFSLGDDSSDENGKLDLNQVGSLGLADASGFVAKVAQTVPILQAPELGTRHLWVDDFAVDDEAVQPRWEVLQRDGRREVRFESFEGMPLQWLLFSSGSAQIAYDDQVSHDGALSLRLTYEIPAGKLLGMLTNPGQAPLGGASRLRFAVRSELPTTLIVGLKERDGSQYDTLVPLAAGTEMVVKDLALADFKLSDDSQDENGRLDLGQVKEFTIGDVSRLLGQANGTNRLWLDDFVFAE